MMKCAAAWVLAFAVALTAVPVAYAEDAAGNPETENTVQDEAVKEAATVDQESLNDQAGQDDQNPDSTEGSVLETENEKAGAEENVAQQTTPGEGVETENPAAVDPAVESEEQTQPAEEAQAEAVQQQTETDVQEKATLETEQEAVLPELTYRTHVQDIGWQSWKKDGEMAGTSGLYKRLEAIELKLSKSDYEGSIEYQTHVQNIGWQGWKRDGQLSGTQARALRLEAIRIRLTGEIAEYYDIYYRVHIQNYGWLPYVKNGAAAGSEAFGLRLEGIEVKLVKKDEGTAPAVGYGFLKNVLYYSGHVQTLGNVKEVKSGSVLGTVGQYKRMEALSVRLKGMDGYASGNIRYQAHVQNIGWQGWKQNGSSAGTTGKALRLEAVQIQLDGEIAQIYDVYYRVHVQNYGWLGWAKNGAVSGTSGFGYRMEAVQIQLVPKGWKAPGSTAHAYLKNYTNNDLTYSGHVQNVGNVAAVKGGATLGTVGKGRRLEGFSINLNDSADGLAKGSIQYRAHVQDIGWQGWKQEGTLAGTTGQGKRMEAVQIRLTGELASYYHVYYRVHSQYFGWLGWAKNGQSAGTTGYGYRMEALQIQMVPKGGNAPANSGYYKQYTGKKSLNVPLTYQNPKYPNGCEAISLYMVLRYYGYMLTTNDVCNKYLPRGPLHSTNPYAAYMGNPGSLTGGYGCWAPVICQTAANYFKAVNVKNRSAKNITGTSLEGLFQYIDKGMPVVVWGTLNMGSTTWFRAGRKNGVTFYWPSRAHCVVLTGYDKNRKVVKVNDPIRGKVEYSFSSFEKAYRIMNRNAMVIQ